MKEKIAQYWKFGFGILSIISGLLLSRSLIETEFLGFSSVGSWLIYVGLVSLAVVTLQTIKGKKRLVDERMQFVATKAARVTFVALIFFAFIVMIIDGIKPITIAYSYFMSYLICGMLVIYAISYKLLLRVN